MAKQNKPNPKVRTERLPNRRAVECVREAIQFLKRQANETLNQEAEDEHIGRDLCTRVDPATRAGSDD